MKDGKKGGMCGGLWSHRSCIVGGFFLIVGTLLTLQTLSGFGILGMFLAGMMLCRGKGNCCGCGCGCGCHASSMTEGASCDIHGDDAELVVPKPVVKRAPAKKKV